MLQYGRHLSSHLCFLGKKWCCFYILLKGIVNHLYVSFHFGVNDRIPWTCWFLWFFFTVFWGENLYITLESMNLFIVWWNPYIASVFSLSLIFLSTNSCIHASILITFPVIILLTHPFPFCSLFIFTHKIDLRKRILSLFLLTGKPACICSSHVKYVQVVEDKLRLCKLLRCLLQFSYSLLSGNHLFLFFLENGSMVLKLPWLSR